MKLERAGSENGDVRTGNVRAPWQVTPTKKLAAGFSVDKIEEWLILWVFMGAACCAPTKTTSLLATF
jgi:hypothetical protein